MAVDGQQRFGYSLYVVTTVEHRKPLLPKGFDLIADRTIATTAKAAIPLPQCQASSFSALEWHTPALCNRLRHHWPISDGMVIDV